MHVDKELFGDTFRRAPRLTPLEARAIRLALEFVGPMIAAGSHSPLDRVRAKLEEAFGAFDLAQTPRRVRRGGGPRRHAHPGDRPPQLVELEYLKPEATEVETRTIEPYGIERRLPHWYVHTWDVDRDAPRSYRLDRTKNAKLLRSGFPRARGSTVRSSSGDDGAHLVLARGRRAGRSRRAPGRSSTAPRSPSAPSGSSDWLVGEVLSFRGEAVVIEPVELRALVAVRARELDRELRAARARTAPTAATRALARCSAAA